MKEFYKQVEVLRWDDHRYYHHSRINQTLHLISAISFLVSYVLLFVSPALAGLVGWLIGMVTRQSGHMFFEPRGYDEINDASDEHKEAIKVGYNMRRKAVLIGFWLLLPALLLISPSLFGLMEVKDGVYGFMHNLGLLWLGLGLGGVLFRTIHLFFIKGVSCGLAWAFKIITDPFHNIAIYWKSPLALMQGQLYDPMNHDYRHA